MKRHVLFGSLALVAAAAGAYLVPPPGRHPVPPGVVHVGAHDNFFAPIVVQVPPGTTVQWMNLGRHPHTTTSTNGIWDSGDLPPGATHSVTFQRQGVYYYYCRHHPMGGSVVVGAGYNSE